LYELQKAKKELKDSIEKSKIQIKEKISDVKKTYQQLKFEINNLFKEMERQMRINNTA